MSFACCSYGLYLLLPVSSSFVVLSGGSVGGDQNDTRYFKQKGISNRDEVPSSFLEVVEVWAGGRASGNAWSHTAALICQEGLVFCHIRMGRTRRPPRGLPVSRTFCSSCRPRIRPCCSCCLSIPCEADGSWTLTACRKTRWSPCSADQQREPSCTQTASSSTSQILAECV